MNFRIDPEFKDYLGALDGESKQALEESLMAEGCRDALVVWPQADGDPILLDGHNRHAICDDLGISYRVVECPVPIADREGAVAWIVQNQRARRNLTREQLRYYYGKIYLAEKKSTGGDGSNQHSEECGQNVHIPKTRTGERIAHEFGINEKTVRRNAEFAQQIDAIAAEHGPEVKAEILAGRKKVADFAPPPEPPAVDTPSPAPAPEEPVANKPSAAEQRDMSDSECVLWMAKNLPPTMDSGARPGAVHIADAVSDNLADPDTVANYSSSFMFALCELERHAAGLPATAARENPSPERRELFKKRLSTLLDELRTFMETL